MIICDFLSFVTFHLQTKSIMSTVIPLVADAVASIVKNSTNDSFKESCRNIMKVYITIICTDHHLFKRCL